MNMEQRSTIIDVGEPATIHDDASGFDYTSLDLTDSAMTSVIAERDKVRMLFTRSQENFFAIGHALITIKELLPHGTFGPWLDAEFGWHPSSARRFMQVAEQFPEIAHVERFEPSALYALAAKAVPEQVRDQFISQADAGQPVRLQDVRAAIGKQRNPRTDPTAIECVAEIVRLIDRAYGVRGVRTKLGFGTAVNPQLFEQEIAEYDEDDQQEIARALVAFGEACQKAASPYLKGG